VAHTLSANKRIRQSEKRRLRNKAYKSKMRTTVKKFLSAVESADVEASQQAFDEAQKVITKIGSKGVIHKNQVARRVSRLAARLNALKSA